MATNDIDYIVPKFGWIIQASLIMHKDGLIHLSLVEERIFFRTNYDATRNGAYASQPTRVEYYPIGHKESINMGTEENHLCLRTYLIFITKSSPPEAEIFSGFLAAKPFTGFRNALLFFFAKKTNNTSE